MTLIVKDSTPLELSRGPLPSVTLIMKKPLEKGDVNTGKPRPYNTESYDQKADTGIEKSH